MSRATRKLAPVLACAVLLGACEYVVVPPEEDGGGGAVSKGWSAVATAVGPAE